jgi:hypothetical protein
MASFIISCAHLSSVKGTSALGLNVSESLRHVYLPMEFRSKDDLARLYDRDSC